MEQTISMTQDTNRTDITGTAVSGVPVYEPPALTVIGSVHTLTLNRCWWGKKWGGVDGLEFMNIQIPVSSC